MNIVQYILYNYVAAIDFFQLLLFLYSIVLKLHSYKLLVINTLQAYIKKECNYKVFCCFFPNVLTINNLGIIIKFTSRIDYQLLRDKYTKMMLISVFFDIFLF